MIRAAAAPARGHRTGVCLPTMGSMVCDLPSRRPNRHHDHDRIAVRHPRCRSYMAPALATLSAWFWWPVGWISWPGNPRCSGLVTSTALSARNAALRAGTARVVARQVAAPYLPWRRGGTRADLLVGVSTVKSGRYWASRARGGRQSQGRRTPRRHLASSQPSRGAVPSTQAAAPPSNGTAVARTRPRRNSRPHPPGELCVTPCRPMVHSHDHPVVEAVGRRQPEPTATWMQCR